MRSIGFLVSHKEHENRIAIIPNDLKQISNKKNIYIESGYGKLLGYSDDDYVQAGANIAPRAEVMSKDVICDCKIGDEDYLKILKPNQILFGWIHAEQNRVLTDTIINKKLTAIAWENMFEDNRHAFWRNNEIAGEAAIMHAYCLYGKLPYETKVAVLGRGNTARGAYKILTNLGAKVHVYSSKMDPLFKKEIGNYDVIVCGILWDVKRKDHLIYREDLKRMKKGSMIIDISCDHNKAIETSEPTTISNPTYTVDGVLHYVVDHTPSIFYKSTSKSISKEVSKYLDIIIESKEETNEVLKDAIIFKNGKIIDKKIKKIQNR